MGAHSLDGWFTREILPLEPVFTRFLNRNWSDRADVADLRQEAYVRVCEAAARDRPEQAKPFLFQTARNLMTDRRRRKAVVSIETMANCEDLNICSDAPSPEEHVAGRQQIRMLQAALDKLSPRCRQVVLLRKVEGLSQREVAQRLGIAEGTVEQQIVKGMRALTLSVCGSRAAIITGAKRHLNAKMGAAQKATRQ